MVPHTRRRLLHAATAAVVGGLAGCGRLTGDATQSSQSASENNESNGPANGTATDPETVLLRADSERQPIRLTNPDRETSDTESPRPERFSHRMTNALVDSQARSRRLTVADGQDESEVSSFVSATDFDSETLYLETNVVKECFRLQLCRVSWRPSKVETDYGRTLRPYDERCSEDESVFESRLIRLPVALDEASVNSYASSISGSPCDATGRARADGSGGSSHAEGSTGSGGSASELQWSIDEGER